jgi:uncharacterized protein
MLDDTPHSIALGTAVGVFFGMTPTVGLQMFLVIVFAFLTRPFFHFNRVAALIAVYLSNPLTMVPIYWFDYKVGTLFFEGELTRDDFARVLHYEGFAQWWDAIVALFIEIGAPLIVGSLVVGTVCGLITYPCMRWLVESFRRQPPAVRPEKQPAASTTE